MILHINKDGFTLSSDNVFVVLSASKFNLHSDSEELNNINVPLCIVTMLLDIHKTNIEKIEHETALKCIDMSKNVDVNVDKRTVVIYGKNKEDDALVIYEDLKRNEHSNEFFKRWIETKTLLFEFQVHNADNVDVFAIRGLWTNNAWFGLKITPFSNAEII